MLKLTAPLPLATLAVLTDTDKILGLAARSDLTKAAMEQGALLAATMQNAAMSADNRKLALRRFQAVVVAAEVAGKADKVKEAYTEARPGEWKDIKDAFSKARKLAAALITGSFPVPTPKASDRKRITVAGKTVTTLDKSHLPALADPLFGDTPVSTLLSKVVNAEAEPETSDEAPAELVKSEDNAFMAELARRLGDPVEFHTLLPLFDQALVAHTGAAPMVDDEPVRAAA